MENVANNNDVLSNLYALRAGLSVISQKADQIKGTEKKIGNQLDYIKRMQWYSHERYEKYGFIEVMYCEGREIELKELEKIKKDLGCIRNGYRSDEYNKLMSNLDALNEYRDKVDLTNLVAFCEWLRTKEAEEYFSTKKSKLELSYKGLELQIERCREQIEYFNKKKKKFTILTVLTIPTIIGAIIFNELKFKYIRLQLGVYQDIESYNKQLEKYDDELKKYKTDLQNIKSSREIIKQNDEENMPIIKSVKQDTDVIYESLQKQFGKVLDERDWQYLDLIIYYLETGRADSKKEALQLLEKEIQAQRIVGAIQKATESICSTIERVADRISAQLGVISSQLALISSQYQVQIEQNNILISQAQMQNALIAKASVTSEQLMKDVSYIKKNGIVIK